MDTIQFNAGLMALSDGVMKADPRKGLICVYEEEEGMVHFQWHTRSDAGQTVMELDTIVMPGEATFTKLARPGSRIFHLKFAEDSSRDMFFWCQEPHEAHDEHRQTAIDAAINGNFQVALQQFAAAAAPAATQGAPAFPASSSGGITPAALASILSNIAGGSSAAAGTASNAPAASSTQAQAALAAQILSSIAGGGVQQQRVATGPSLADVLTTEALSPLLDDDDIVERLKEYLPEQHRTPHAVRTVLASPQLRHQLHMLSVALKTGQLDFSQFGLPHKGFTAADFLSAIQEAVDAERAKKSSSDS